MVYLGETGPIPKPAKAVRDTKLMRDLHSVRPHCQRCGAVATSEHRIGRLHVAHIVSRGRRGGDTFGNLLVMCFTCHMIDDHDKGLLSDADKRRLKAHDERVYCELYRWSEQVTFGQVRWAVTQ